MHTQPDDCEDGCMVEVAGWVHADNVTRACQYLASYVGAKWDDFDQDALEGHLAGTDAERDDGWFEYPVGGDPVIVISVAVDPGTDVVQLRVRGNLTDVLVARFDTLLDVL
jgi:hypothetical protein